MCFVFFFICGKNSIRLVRRIIFNKNGKRQDKYKKIQANLKMMRKSFSAFIIFIFFTEKLHSEKRKFTCLPHLDCPGHSRSPFSSNLN